VPGEVPHVGGRSAESKDLVTYAADKRARGAGRRIDRIRRARELRGATAGDNGRHAKPKRFWPGLSVPVAVGPKAALLCRVGRR
jgi:hypothetical protein